MYDPTPLSITFMNAHKANSSLKYSPIGIWIEDKTLRFYEPKLGGSASMMSNEESNNKYFEAKCETMKTVMKRNQHDHISVFKADIEGAALPILGQMIENQIFPDQIVVEFERPKKDMLKINDFFNDLTELRSKLGVNNYEEFLLPRKTAKYFSLEMLFVNKRKIQ